MNVWILLNNFKKLFKPLADKGSKITEMKFDGWKEKDSDKNFVYHKKAADILNSYIIERILINNSVVTKRWFTMLLESKS